MNRSRVTKLISMVGLFTAAACTSPARVSTGIARDTQLQQLTAEQTKSACLATIAGEKPSDATIRGQCATRLAHTAPSTCASQLEACVSQTKTALDQSLNTASCDNTASSLEHFAGCTGTIGNLEDCLSSALDQYDTIYGSATCDKPATATEVNPFSSGACQALAAKCPGVIESGMPAQG